MILPNCLPRWLYNFAFPLAVNESFYSLFAAVSILAFGHSDRFLVALKSGFKKQVSLGMKPPYDPAIPLLGIYPEETKIEKDTCTPLFIAALFTIAGTWKQPRCPLTDEWIKKLWYIYAMEYYSAIKLNTFESVLMRWMNLEPIIHSEVSQKEKVKYHILSIYTDLEKCY